MNKIIWIVVIIVLIVLGVKYFGGDDTVTPPAENTPAAVGAADTMPAGGTDTNVSDEMVADDSAATPAPTETVTQ